MIILRKNKGSELFEAWSLAAVEFNQTGFFVTGNTPEEALATCLKHLPNSAE